MSRAFDLVELIKSNIARLTDNKTSIDYEEIYYFVEDTLLDPTLGKICKLERRSYEREIYRELGALPQGYR